MRYSILKIIPIFALSLCCAELVHGREWRGIVPLKSTRADVERLLGKPNGLGRYEFENERAHIDYAKGCDQSKNCLCLVPKDTVVSIFVTLESELKLFELKINIAKYKKKPSSHLPGIVNFTDEQEGITYTVDEGDEEVMHITYLPRRLDCQNLINRVRTVKQRLSRQRCKHARQVTESWNTLASTQKTFNLLTPSKICSSYNPTCAFNHYAPVGRQGRG